MKVLFAVSNEDISESIVKKYQKEYKQIISYKNVYYFNAILKELQKDKTYDRIVISEDLEAFTHTQYEQIDKFIFEKLDSISDEASNIRGNDTPIILICSDRRTKSEPMLVKLFGIGVYNAIIGNDRSVDEVCRLINRPRVKKEAKSYYKIDTEEVNYQAENENDVSEMEIQNIVAHYKRLGKNEERYIDSFNNIAAQYNDTQLRIITKFLPLNVRAVLEEKSPKYQQIMSFHNSVSDKLRKNKDNQEEGPSQVLLKSQNREKILSKPVVIPSAVNMSGNKKLAKHKPMVNNTQQETPPIEETVQPVVQARKQQPLPQYTKTEPIIEGFEDFEDIEEMAQPVEVEEPVQAIEKEVVQPVKRGRGRPRKNPISVPNETNNQPQPVKRGRGRPRTKPIVEVDPNKPKRGRGRPRKEVPKLENQESITQAPVETSTIEEVKPINQEQESNLFDISEEIEQNATIEKSSNEQNTGLDLFNMDLVPETSQINNETEPMNHVNSDASNNILETSEVDLFNIEDEVTPIQQTNNTNDFYSNTENYTDFNQSYTMQNNHVNSSIEEADLFNMGTAKENDFAPDLAIDMNVEEERQAPYKEEQMTYNGSNENTEVDLFDIEGNEEENDIMTTDRVKTISNLNNLLTSDKKIVAFVGEQLKMEHHLS